MIGHYAGPSIHASPLPASSRSIEPGRRLRIGVLHNPLSRRNHVDSDEVQQVLARFPEVHVHEVRNPADVLAALETLSQEDIELLLVNGGDGTIQATLTALFHQAPFSVLPFLGVLPSGTTNMIAGDVGLRGSRSRALDRLCRWVPTSSALSPFLKRHVLRVESDFHAGPLCGMFFGAGGILEGIDYCRRAVEAKGIRGELGPAVALARFLWGLIRGRSDILKPVPLAFSVDGHAAIESESLAFLITTLDHLFLGLRPYWGREAAPLAFTHIRAHPQYLPLVLWALLRGRPHRLATTGNGYHSANVHRVEVRAPSGFTLDGELFRKSASDGHIVISHAGQVTFVQL